MTQSKVRVIVDYKHSASRLLLSVWKLPRVARFMFLLLFTLETIVKFEWMLQFCYGGIFSSG